MTATSWAFSAATAVLSVLYLYLGTRPAPPPVLADASDLLIHGFAYALLAACASATASSLGVTRAACAGFLYAVAHGVLLEAVQLAAPPRQAEAKDIVVDAIAAFAGVLPWLARRRA